MSAIGKVFSGRVPKRRWMSLQLAQVGGVVVPLERLAHALGRIVGAGQDVLEAVLRGEVVQRGEERVVLRRVEMRHLRLEERELQILHLLPVDHLGVQVEAEAVDELLDVVHRLLRVPAGVDMEDQRPQPELLLGEVGDVGAVDAAADADDAVVVAALAVAL